jgi:membrane protease subunit HflC
MRRGIFGGVGLVILIVIAIAVYLSIFIVSQTQQALVLRFGQVVRELREPGLYYKLPLIDNVVYFDKRILDLDSPPLEIIASDQKRLVVDAWGRYRIVNPLLFYQSVGSIEIADSRLSVLLNSAVRQVLGDATFIQLVRDQRATLMSRITARVDREARGLGVEVVDVKIRRADLPEANSQAIYQRMQTERQQEATEIRALGEQQARRIRAEADRTAVVIVAEAQREAEQTRGKGEADRNRILAEAFNADPDFFAFYRSMQAYQEGLGSAGTRWVISPESEFFRFFNNSQPGGDSPVSRPNGVPPEATAPPAPSSLPPGDDAPPGAAEAPVVQPQEPAAAEAAPATETPPAALAGDGGAPINPAAEAPAAGITIE